MKATRKSTKSSAWLSMILAVLFNCIMGALIAPLVGYSPLAGMVAANVLAVVPAVFQLAGYSMVMPSNSLFAGVIKEAYTDIIKEQFIMEGEFLKRSTDLSSFVDNGVINLADAGVEPDVLINNTTFPIPMSQRTDAGLPLPLDYYSTKTTFVTSLEEAQSAYDKTASVTRGHKRALQRNVLAKAAHSWTPGSDAAFTPVLAATGADRGNGTHKLTIEDIVALQTKFDQLEAPVGGRILVLNPLHRQDLLNEDRALFKAFANLKTGEVLALYGFDVYVYAKTAIFNKSTGVKAAYGAAAAGTDTVSSFAYLEEEVMHALGTLEMFYQLNAPDVQGDKFNFGQQFTALPIRNKAIGAIYSAAV